MRGLETVPGLKMATATRWLCRCFRHRLTGFPQVVHVRQFAIQPPEWLGGSIPKQILGPPLDEWKNFKERLEGKPQCLTSVDLRAQRRLSPIIALGPYS